MAREPAGRRRDSPRRPDASASRTKASRIPGMRGCLAEGEGIAMRLRWLGISYQGRSETASVPDAAHLRRILEK